MQILKQDTFGHKLGKNAGNCFQRCVSAVTSIPIKHVPNFCAYEDWHKRLKNFCYFHNLELYAFNYTKENVKWCNIMNLPYITSGLSPRANSIRGKYWHSIVFYKGIAYDPHFTNCKLRTKEEINIIVPRNKFFVKDEKLYCRY